MTPRGSGQPGVTRRRFVAVLGAIGLSGVAAACSRLVADPTATTTGGSAATTATTSTTTPPASTSLPPVSSTTDSATTTTTAPEATTTPPETGTAATVTVIGRDGWGARPIDGELTPHILERITVHHTAVTLERNALAPAHIRGHQEYHQLELGWADLAYHFMVDAEGNIYEGRPYDTVGDTATSYDPTGHLLVCCEGDFNTQPFPAAQRRGLISIISWAVSDLGLDPATITGHRDHAATTCPGDPVAALIDDGTLTRRVARRAAGGSISIDILKGASAIDVVAAIEAG